MFRKASQFILRYLWNVIVSIDQTVNAFLGGDRDETLSGRMGKRLDTCRVCRFVCRLLDFLEKDHCIKSIEADEGKDEVIG